MLAFTRVAGLAAILCFATGTLTGTQSAVPARITSPEQQFGAAIGDDYFLATWDQFQAYWRVLDRQSDRMTVVEIGRTEEGRPQPMAIVSAPENLRRLEGYKGIARRLALAEGVTDREARMLAREGKAVVLVAGGLHANETLGVQQLIETVYQLVSRNDAETERVLRDVIVLALHANPDGHALVGDWYMREADPMRRRLTDLPRLYQKYAGHDINRDFFMSTQAETININRVLYREWFPQIVYDHHQTGPPGTVMFAPPFREPSNYVFDPLVLAGIDTVAEAMHARFKAEEKRGVTMRSGASYSTWWNGGLRTASYFHNQIGILTETIGDPSPGEIPYVAATQVAGADLPMPIAPQTWRFRQSIDYSLTANRAVLDVAARQRETWLLNAYRMARNSIERGSRDSWTPTPHRPVGRPPDPALRDPRGYILPSAQPDFPTAVKFVNALLRSGIVVHRARMPFTVGGKSYPAGSFIVRTAQAFRPHVLDMFEPQDHPDDVPQRGGPPTAPYDSAGWTLAYQMGVRFDRVLDAFEGPFERVTAEVAPPPGRLEGSARPAGFLISHHQNDAFIAVNRLLAAGESVYWLRDRTTGSAGGTGSMYVPSGRSARRILERAAADLGLTVVGVGRVPAGEMLQLTRVRVALVDVYGGSASSGWIRWLLERYEFPFAVVDRDDIDTGRGARGFDVWILPSDVAPGRSASDALKQLAEAGATVLAIGQGASAFARLAALPVSSAPVEALADGTTRPLSRDQFFIPGSVLRVAVDNTTPLAYGFEREVDVFFDDGPVFRFAGPQRGTRAAWFHTAAPLRSGWALGQRYLEGGLAAADLPVGRGRILLFGPEITYRAQPHGTFKFLFNGIYYGSAVDERP